jgi:hypothetical protein
MDNTTSLEDITQDTLWRKNGWVAKVVKNLDDDGWAVEMIRVGDSEPALVGPWVMGRDKKNPKPLNAKDFSTLVKTANEVLERAASHAKNALHKSITIVTDSFERLRVDLDIARDEDDPHAILSWFDEGTGAELGSKRVEPSFKLTSANAEKAVRTAA